MHNIASHRIAIFDSNNEVYKIKWLLSAARQLVQNVNRFVELSNYIKENLVILSGLSLVCNRLPK